VATRSLRVTSTTVQSQIMGGGHECLENDVTHESAEGAGWLVGKGYRLRMVEGMSHDGALSRPAGDLAEATVAPKRSSSS
jgi:hypothetical protein